MGSRPRAWCRSGRREAAIADLRVGFGCEAEPDEEDDDDRRQNGADRVDREGGGRRSRARDAGLRRRADHGDRGRGAHRRRPRQPIARSNQSPQRLSRSCLGDAGRPDRSRDPEAAQGNLPAELPGTAAHCREGLGGGDPGGLREGHLDPLGRRSDQGDGRLGDFEEPGQPSGRGDRRAGRRLPRPPDRRRMAVSVDRRDLPEGPRRRSDRVDGGDNRGRRQHRRPPRGARCRHRPVGGGGVLEGLPPFARRSRPARRSPRRRRRSQGLAGGGIQGVPRHASALPGSLDAQRSRPCRPEAAPGGRGTAEDDLRPGERRGGPRAVAPRRRCAAREIPEARGDDGRQPRRRSRLHGLSA